MTDAVFFSVVALAKAGIECCRNAQICKDEAARIGKRLTIVVARAHEWGAVCESTRLAHFHEVVENVFLRLQATTSSVNRRSLWNRKFKIALQPQTILCEILKAESQLNTAINDLQMEQSNAIFSHLLDVSKGVADLLDQFGALALSKSDPSATIQRQVEKALAETQVRAPQVAVANPDDVSQDGGRGQDPTLATSGMKVSHQYKTTFCPSKDDVLAISLQPSLLKFCDDHESLLGGGGFAEVFRGTYNLQPVAIKRLKVYRGDVNSLSKLQIARDVEQLAAEALLTHKCGTHSNIIHVVGCLSILSEVERPLLVMELMHTTLFDVIHDRVLADALAFSRRLYLLKGIAGALEFLHLQGIVHHDIKSLNILLNKKIDGCQAGRLWESKVKGLNTTKLRLGTILAATSHQGNQIAGTAAYQAPEILSEEVKDTSRVCEMYSFGVTVWECVTSKIPHGGKKESSIALLAATKKYLPMLAAPSSPPKDLSETESASWKALNMVAASCLSRDRSVRPTASIVVALWHKVKSPEVEVPYSFFQDSSFTKMGDITESRVTAGPTTQGTAKDDLVMDVPDDREKSKCGAAAMSKNHRRKLLVVALVAVLLTLTVTVVVVLVSKSSPDLASPASGVDVPADAPVSTSPPSLPPTAVPVSVLPPTAVPVSVLPPTGTPMTVQSPSGACLNATSINSPKWVVFNAFKL